MEARGALLDALEALRDHLRAVIVIGAQAIYLHTGGAAVALAEATKDSDLALDKRVLANEPLLEDALRAANFIPNPETNQPGAWVTARGIPVDLMVPEALAGTGGRRAARIPPHAKHVARRAAGLEATVVDYTPMQIEALDPSDTRVMRANVAGPAALLIAKLHKVGERTEMPGRLNDKDAHDIYRLLVATSTADMAAAIKRLYVDQLAGHATQQALGYLGDLFAAGPEAVGSIMAGRAEEGVGDPAVVAASVAVLSKDLVEAI